MITFNILTLLLLVNNRLACGQYLLAEYAPNHDNYRPAHYHFAYGVSDPSTGDHKHHWEKRQGDHVVGEYGLLEPDGATRIVQYTADPHHGFQAVVTRIENPHAVQHQYTSGHALYGQQNGLFNQGNVVQFGQAHEHVALTAQTPTVLPNHDNQYYLNQYANGYQQAPQQQVVLSPGVSQNAYSTLEHQPNYDVIKPEHRGGDLPLHVIENINNQYGGSRQQPAEPRGFAYNLETNIQNINAQSINALQENPGHQQVFVTSTERPQTFVSSTPSYEGTYISSTPENAHSPTQHSGGYVSSTPSTVEQHYSPNVQHSYNGAPIQQTYVSSTQSPLEHNYISTPSPLDHSPGYSSTPAPPSYVSSTESPLGYVSSTQAPVDQNQNYHQKFPTDVQIIPNGQNVHQVPLNQPIQVQVTTEKPSMNPLLKNLVNFLQNHMPDQYKERFETMFKPYLGSNGGTPTSERPQVYVSSTPNEISSTGGYVSTPSPISDGGYSTPSPIAGGYSTPSPISNGYSTPSQVSGGYSTPSPIASGGYVTPTPAYIGSPSDQNIYQGSGVSSTPSTLGSQYQNNPYLNGEVNLGNFGNLGNVDNPNPQSSRQDYAQNPYVTGEIAVGQVPKDYLIPGVTPTPEYPENVYRAQARAGVNENVYQNQGGAYGSLQGVNQGVSQGLSQGVAQDRIDSADAISIGDYKGDSTNYDSQNNARKIYYELDPAGYQGDYQGDFGGFQNRRDTTQQQGKDGTVFVVRNENGRNLRTPNFYQPVNPNMYPDNPFPNYDQNGASNTQEFIWNAGDYSAPLDPEGNILVRQLNQTCASFRFNTTNDYEQKDQDIHVWNSGDYSALRAEEQLIRSINVTCNNFTNDYTNNFTSGFSLWHYCSQCLNSDASDVNIVQTETIVGPDGNPQEFITSKTQQDQIASNPYQDPRSNAEIAGIVKVYNPQNLLPTKNSGSNNFANLLSTFNAEVNRRKPIYVPNFEEGEYDYSDSNSNNGLYKRDASSGESADKFVVLVKKSESS